MIGQTISHYRIIDKLRRGGMGEVYLAEDTCLGREVALTVLDPELARDHEWTRFSQMNPMLVLETDGRLAQPGREPDVLVPEQIHYM